MLKKLVKYGNSNALILDRSILALLGISEGSIIKLRVEGDTLIIKGEKNIRPTEALMSEIETIDEQMTSMSPATAPLMEIVRKNTVDLCNKIEGDAPSMELLEEWLPGTEKYLKLQEAFEKNMKKYQKAMEPLYSREFQQEIENLNAKYKVDKGLVRIKDVNSDAYRKELFALRLKFCPEIEKMDKEMLETCKAHGYPEQLCNLY